MSRPGDAPAPQRLRLDKWLWAARFYRTRTLASAAVEAGQVRVAAALDGEGYADATAVAAWMRAYGGTAHE